ncbi:ATP-binding protein [Spirosoma utsteinense]|uniref:ATP-binding protein n=1 Tax=Spirosoma utsteinense TaxID=2585773 RepID=UPI001646D6E8|nr:ATP-binding protein [Spirosoma utsteinense]MBC3788206.1 light-regulated signal transduction histidine kinase (bacteriophytochrome) [Spirosoma utsteinense]
MTYFEVDITNCEQEPIHILGHIQSHGYLCAIHPDTYTIVHASANLADLVGQPIADVLGQSLAEVLNKTDLPAATLIELLNVGKRNDSWDTLNPYRLQLDGRFWNLVVHAFKGLLLLEWEPTDEQPKVAMNQRLIADALTEVQSSRQLADLLQNTAQRVKSIIGFDRVMVYRFSADWHGQVIAEAREPELEPFLGLHYPASDIPRQARELYKINLVRLIADAGSVPSPILSQPGWPNDAPLDLTHSTLRAVSPVHIEYLNNMGVQASMSISLLYPGELWGLISCHHHAPRFVDYAARQAAKFVSQLLSAALEFRKGEEDQSLLLHSLENGQRLHEQLLADEDVVRALTRRSVTALDLVAASGAVLLFNNQQHRLGTTPDEAAVRDLAEWLKTTLSDTFLETSHLPALYPPAGIFRHQGAGILAVVLSRELNEYLIWFKPERIQEVTWAGNPQKAVTVSDDGQHRIGPRKSFEAWTEMVHNTSEPWGQAEVAAAIKLREDILQIVTRQANEIRQLNQRLQAAYEELDAFSYTVSHDLRTPLSSIRCYSEILLEEYGDDFNPDARALFQKVIDSTDRMRALIHHILFYSRMGRTEVNTQLVDMNHLLTSMRDEILLTEKDRSLAIDIADTPAINADPTMLSQLFMNLLTNAAKYTRSTPAGHIQVSGKQTDEDVIYSITDNGIGFDMKEADKMFELFKRLENARSFKGTGVGLAIVKRIITRHHGKIWYQSEPNRGATFFVSFPLIAVD